MFDSLTKSRLAVLVGSVMIIGGLLLPSLAAAGVVDTTSNFVDVGDDVIADKTIDPGTDTRALFVEYANSTNTSAEQPVNATIYEVTDSGIETQVEKVQLNLSSVETELFEFSSINTSEDSSLEYRVVVEANSSKVDSSAVSVGSVQEVAAGGGGLLGGGETFDVAGYEIGQGILVGIVLLVVGGVLLKEMD
jgi:hypothetical protein